MKRTLQSFLPLFFLLVVAQDGKSQSIQSFASISGYIYDAETEAPIDGANVFIANSLLGAASNAEGYFEINGVPFGTHDVVASYIGYEGASEEIRITSATALSITFRLIERVYSTDGIEVVGVRTKRDVKQQREHARDLKKFRKFFLGVSPNAEKCKILNPEVLSFSTNETSKTFTAVANDALLIENQALGYRIRFLLDEFMVRDEKRDKYIKYSGKAGFSELIPPGKRASRKWNRNRERAYKGSERHFLAALTADHLWEEGFMLLEEGAAQADYSGVPGARPSTRVFTIKPEDILTEAELDFERVLEFDGYLKVIYMKGVPNAEYLDFKDYVAGWKLRDDEEQQTSWLALTSGPVTITTNGLVQGKYGLTKLGYWFFERVAEMLPTEYQPEEGLLPSVVEVVEPNAQISPVIAYQEGLRFVNAGEYEAAAVAFRKVYEIDPGFSLGGSGSAAYWLGHSYTNTNKKTEAHLAWALGMEVFTQRNQFDVLLADAYVRDIFEREQVADYEAATETYLKILESVDGELQPKAREIVERHLKQTVFLLPEEEQLQILSREVRGYMQDLPLQPQSGGKLATWWRAQDAFPGSSVNERVVEHLKRVFFAEKQFSDPGSPIAYDDRGLVFTQFGNPRTRTIITTDLRETRDILRANAVPLPGPMVVPPNEFWAYRHVDELLHFTFLLKNGRYQISSPEELVPDDLRTASKRVGQRQLGTGGASINRVNEIYANALIAAWQTIYEDLALHHPKFEEQLQELEMYAADVRATGGVKINTGQENPLDTGGGISSLSYTSGLEGRFGSWAHEAKIMREEEAPKAHTTLMDNVEPLPVAVRAARFLNNEGQTRTEVFWSHIPGTLALSRKQRKEIEEVYGTIPDRYLVQLDIVVLRDDFSRETTTTMRYTAADLLRGAPAPVQSFEVDATDPSYHLNMQWGQYLYTDDDTSGVVTMGEELKLGVQRLNDMAALSTELGILEMSDLKPVYLNQDGGVFLAERGEENEPAAYPFTTITQQTALGLYFEVYQLAYGTDDQTHFTVEYEVIRDAEKRRGQKRTSATTSYTSLNRTAKEYIAVDLSEYGDKGTLDIRVTVTDEVSRQQVERIVKFNLADGR